MKIKTNTVTIDLETYKQMDEEIKCLRKQVQEKTIIKYYMHPVYGHVILLIGIIVMILLEKLM